MHKELIFNNEARQGIKRGLDKVANAVKATLGPKGRVCVSSRKIGMPLITKDGVTVAREITLSDPLEEIGAKLARGVAANTVEDVGDGTTTTVVLLQELVNQGLNLINKGAEPQALRKGMEVAIVEVAGAIDELSVPVNSQKDIEHVASISSNDSELGTIISNAFEKVGKDGVLTIEEGRTFGVEVDITPGMRINSGFISPYFITDPGRMEAVYEDAHILVTDCKISSIRSLINIFEELGKMNKREIVIIADDFSTEVLGILIRNKSKSNFSSLAIKAPHFGLNKTEILKDIAVLTGATFISKDAGMVLDAIDVKDLGTARKIVSNKTNTTIIGGGGDSNKITERAQKISQDLEEAQFHEKEKLKARLGNLTGGIGVIKVGAPSEVEMREKMHRIEDAVLAVKASIDEGIVQGGGIALIRAGQSIRTDKKFLKTDDSKGFQLVLDVLDTPIKQILRNAGLSDKIIKGLVHNHIGYDAATGEYRDMFQAGIIDPAKVVKTTLINAVSIAIIILTCEVAIVEHEEDKVKYIDKKDYK